MRQGRDKKIPTPFSAGSSAATGRAGEAHGRCVNSTILFRPDRSCGMFLHKLPFRLRHRSSISTLDCNWRSSVGLIHSVLFCSQVRMVPVRFVSGAA